MYQIIVKLRLSAVALVRFARTIICYKNTRFTGKANFPIPLSVLARESLSSSQSWIV
jgi:hypothetical protein